MKNILAGTGIGAATGIFADKIINEDNQHSYVKSAIAGAVIGGVAGKLFAHGGREVASTLSAPAKNTAVNKSPTVITPTTTKPVENPTTTKPVENPATKSVANPTSIPNVVPQSAEPLRSPIPKSNKIKEAAGFISSGISSNSGKILTSLKAQASSIQTRISQTAHSMVGSISAGASKVKDIGYDLLSNLKYSVSGIAKGLVATAREAKIPTVNLQLAKLKAPSIDLNLPQISKRNALLAAAFSIIPQTLHNPQAPIQITHAQQTMATSSFGTSAYNMMTQAFDDVTYAIPRMMEHPKQTLQKAYDASAIKPTVEASALPRMINSTQLPNYSDEIARRMVINKTNNDLPFIVADPKYGTLSTYDASGKRTGIHTALFGKNQLNGNDNINPFVNPEINTSLANAMSKNTDAGYEWLDRNNLRRIHPGVYQYRKVLLDYSSKYGKFGLQDTNVVGKSNNSSGLGFAIHNTYLGTPLERRAMRLKSKTVDDNFISYGCVNIDPKQLQKIILPKLGERVQVAMASVDPSIRGRYLGLSDNPMFDNNKAALQLVENLRPASNFIIADKKDRLAGLYSPKGALLDYFPVQIGQDSARSEIFQGGKMGSWTPDRAAFMDQIVRDKRRITPSGVFEMKKQKYKDTGVEYIGDTSYDRNSRQQFAMHSSFGTSSFGCLIPSKDAMSRVLPRLGDTTFVGVLPNSGQLNTSVVQRIDPRGKHKKAFSWF